MMTETSAQQAYELYVRHGVGSQTLLLRAEFEDFWEALDKPDRDYWALQLRRGPTGLSKELLAEFASSDEETIDSELLKSIEERLRSLGAVSAPKR